MNRIDRIIEIENEAIALYMKHNNVFAFGFEALEKSQQDEYKRLYLEEYGVPYVNKY